MRFSQVVLLILLCSAAGCGRLWPNEDRLLKVEESVEALTQCAEEITLANERQDVNYRGLQGEFDAHRSSTNDAIKQLQKSQLTEKDKQDMLESLAKYRLAQAAQVNGARVLPQPPVAPPYTPSSPPAPVPVPVPLTAFVNQPVQPQYQQPPQQQQVMRCYKYKCPNCGKVHCRYY